MTSPRTCTEKTKAKVKVKKVAKGKKTNGAAPHAEPANEVQPSNRGKRPIIRMVTGEHSDIVDMTELMSIQTGVLLYQAVRTWFGRLS